MGGLCLGSAENWVSGEILCALKGKLFEKKIFFEQEAALLYLFNSAMKISLFV
jgi:hypothetical protein